MPKEIAVIGVDLGGTNLRLGMVNRRGEILARREGATGVPDQPALVEALARELKALAAEASGRRVRLRGAGLGVPGRVLPEAGRVAFSPNLPALNECPLADLLKPSVDWPLWLENDANLFALGEHWLGAGAGAPHMLGITLGTGVGGGLILDHRLWTSPKGAVAEVGHITIDPQGRPCHCGNRGCLETLASASWTVVRVQEELAAGAASSLRHLWQQDPDTLTGERLADAAARGDSLALKAFGEVGRGLGQAIAAVVHLLGITRVVIGGQFARAFERFRVPMEEELGRRLTMLPPANVQIVPARLGDDAGLLGAARLAWDKLGERD